MDNTTENVNPLNVREQSLRIEELELRVKSLKKPEYAKISTWTGLVAICVAVTGIVAQGILYQIKSAKAEQDLKAAQVTRDSTNAETKRLTVIRDGLKAEASKLDSSLKVSRSSLSQGATSLETMSDIVNNKSLSCDQALNSIREQLNTTAIDLRSSATDTATSKTTNTSLNTAIEGLFAPKAATRGAAYNVLMQYYATSPQLITSLIDYANNHKDNQNGIYNTLVVLGHLNYSTVPADLQSIRSFAAQVVNNGPKSADRVDKLLKRLPK
jgi:hypothetical protein